MDSFKIVVVLAIAAAISAIAFASSNYWIEEAKQRAVMMKVCTDAGGDWVFSWGNWQCKREKK